MIPNDSIDLLKSLKITRQKVEHRSPSYTYCSDRFFLIFGEEVVSFNILLN